MGAQENPQPLNGTQPVSSVLSSRWAERAILLDARGTVRAVEFAPHHFGLKLVCSMHTAIFNHFKANCVQASISTDNHLRVYECLEQPSLTTWQLPEEIDVLTLPSTSSPSSVSLAFATPTQTSATLEGASASLVAQALQQSQSQPGTPYTQIRPGMGNREADGGWCLSWCKDRYWGEVIAAGCGIGGTVKVLFSLHTHSKGPFMNFCIYR